jgi:hypothetical protein
MHFNTFSNYYTIKIVKLKSVPQNNKYTCYSSDRFACIFILYVIYLKTATFKVLFDLSLNNLFTIIFILVNSLNKDLHMLQQQKPSLN